MFDYSGGEPPENMLTVLRALEVGHIVEYLVCTLIVLCF
jgi:hypothetical protein